MSFLLSESTFDEVSIVTESTEAGQKFRYISGIFAQAGVVNKNKRIYPESILDESMNNYINEYVSKSRAVGELIHPNCYAKGALVVTHNRGIIPIEDVTTDDSVYGVDESGNTVITEVTGVINEQYSGEMVHIKSRSIEALVTPNHRFYLQSRYKGIIQKTAQEINASLNGNNLLAHEYIPQGMVSYGAPDIESIVIPVDGSRAKKYTEDLVIDFDDYAALMGIYLSEGCVDYTKISSGESIPRMMCIAQNVGTGLDLILDLVKRIGLDFSIQSNGEKRRSVRILDARIAKHFSQFGKNCYTKFVPDIIRNSSQRQIEIFLDWYVLGDGTLNKAPFTLKSGEKKVYLGRNLFTVSKDLIRGLEECMLKCGYAINERLQISEKDYKFGDHIIKAENKVPLYRVHFGKRKGAYTTNTAMKSEIEHYEGSVHCLTTGTGNFYVMYNGYSHLTGNSTTVDMNRISHLTTELRKDGKNYIGKARLLNTPTGKIAQALIEGGVKLGVSTRADGSVKMNTQGINEVASGLSMKAIDIVFNPSAPDALVDSIMESEMPIIDALSDDMQLVESIRNSIRSSKSHELQMAKLKAFRTIMESIR